MIKTKRVLVYIIGITIFLFASCKKKSTETLPTQYNGPEAVTVPLAHHASLWNKYKNNDENSIAVLITNNNSNWLGVVHAFKSFGIPFSLTTNVSEAIKHPVVFIYPEISGKTFTDGDANKLINYTTGGGTLIGSELMGRKLMSFFGIANSEPSNTRFSASLVNLQDPVLEQFVYPEEKTFLFGDKKTFPSIFGMYGYIPAGAKTLIEYEDNTALLTSYKQGAGITYAFGIDLGYFIQRCYCSRGFNGERTYVNGYDPALDVFLRIIKKIYLASNPNAVTIGTVPENKKLTICLSHDVDYSFSVENSLKYAAMEKANNVTATYFIQAKYVKDYNDEVFFSPKYIADIKRVYAMGMEIASHSISHSHAFIHFNYGTGKEAYPTYQPFVLTEDSTKDASILGELRVSKFLLEKALNDKVTVSSFRAGYLCDPPTLPQALISTGYKACSNVTANLSRTHLPFQLNYDRGFKEELNIFEYPITIEDEEKPTMMKRYDKAVEVLNKISTYGGFACVLIHPNILKEKFEFEQKIIREFSGKAYFTTLSNFSSWWNARNKVSIAVKISTKTAILTVNSPDNIKGLSFQVPDYWHLDPNETGIKAEKGVIITEKLEGTRNIKFHIE